MKLEIFTLFVGVMWFVKTSEFNWKSSELCQNEKKTFLKIKIFK